MVPVLLYKIDNSNFVFFYSPTTNKRLPLSPPPSFDSAHQVAKLVVTRVVIDKLSGSQPGSTGLSFEAEIGVGLRITRVSPGSAAELSVGIFLAIFFSPHELRAKYTSCGTG